MLVCKLNQISLVFSLIRTLIRIALFYAIVVLRNVCYKSNNCFKASFSDLATVTDFDVHQSVVSVTNRQANWRRWQVLLHSNMSKVNSSIGGFYKRQSVLIHDF